MSDTLMTEYIHPDAPERFTETRWCSNPDCCEKLNMYAQHMAGNKKVFLCNYCRRDFFNAQCRNPRLTLNKWLGGAFKAPQHGKPGIKVPSLETVRESRGYTRSQLAAESGLNIDSIRKWERGVMGVYEDKMARLCEFLGCTEDDLAREV
jgi:DNA-binding XRE family transcriptional regulator